MPLQGVYMIQLTLFDQYIEPVTPEPEFEVRKHKIKKVKDEKETA